MFLRAARGVACLVLVATGCSTPPEPKLASMPVELQGGLVYASACASCHGAQAQGGKTVSLTGSFFEAEWGGSTVSTLANYIAREMPPKRTHMEITPQEAAAVARLLNTMNGNLLAP